MAVVLTIERQPDDYGVVIAGAVGGRELRVEVHYVDLGAAGQNRAHEDVIEDLGVPQINIGVPVVERQPNDHVAFGGFGRHHCLGAQLARLELRVLFEELFRRMPHIELAEPDEPLPRRRGNFVLGLESLPVRFSST